MENFHHIIYTKCLSKTNVQQIFMNLGLVLSRFVYTIPLRLLRSVLFKDICW